RALVDRDPNSPDPRRPGWIVNGSMALIRWDEGSIANCISCRSTLIAPGSTAGAPGEDRTEQLGPTNREHKRGQATFLPTNDILLPSEKSSLSPFFMTLPAARRRRLRARRPGDPPRPRRPRCSAMAGGVLRPPLGP